MEITWSKDKIMKAKKYVSKIRNESKRKYAEAYMKYVIEGGKSPNGLSFGISTMAAQAVRMELGDLLIPDFDDTKERDAYMKWYDSKHESINMSVLDKITAKLDNHLLNENSYRDGVFERVAKKVLNIPTLKNRNSDSLDFYDISVWKLKEAFQKIWDESASIKRL
jgi:hypothetical protein